MKKIVTPNIILDLDQVIFMEANREESKAVCLLKNGPHLVITGPAFDDLMKALEPINPPVA